jgi:hypothetical protein
MKKCNVLASLVASCLLVLAAAAGARAQETSVRVYADPPEVGVGERFRLVVEVSGVERVEQVGVPDPFDFARRIYDSEPVLGVTIAGEGAPRSANSVTLTYDFVPAEAGLIEVGPFRIVADGRTLETEPLTILVNRESSSEVVVRARITPPRVNVGDEFTVTAEITGSPSGNREFVPPDLFGVVDRMSPSGSLSDTRWSWSAMATREGEFTIPPVRVVDGDRTWESEPLTLVVGPRPVTVESSLDAESIWVGGEFDFRLEVRGVSELDEEPATPLDGAVAELLDVVESSHDFGGTQMSRHYSFRALRPGRFEAGPMRIPVNGQTFETQPISFNVSEVPVGDFDPPEGMSLVGRPGKRFAYVGEPVVIEYAVLHDETDRMLWWPIIGTKSWPSYDGFDVTGIRGWSGRREMVDGRRYARRRVRRVALRALRAGQMELGPATVESRIHRPMMRRGRDQASVILTSRPYTLEVFPLPDEGRPASFRGHVGTLEAVSWVDRTRAEVGETVTLQVEVSVDGLVEAHPAPEIDFPPGFEVAEPEVDTDFPRRTNGLRGTRTYTWQLTATTPGTYVIPAVEMSYFDPETESYGMTRGHPFTVTVAPAGDKE